MALKVGDKVRYVPDRCHALDRLPDGTYCWEFVGLDKGGQTVVLTTKRVRDLVSYLNTPHGRHDPKRAQLLVANRPRTTWEAEVTAVNADDTVNLTIKHSSPGMVLHYTAVAVNQQVKLAHTCHQV